MGMMRIEYKQAIGWATADEGREESFIERAAAFRNITREEVVAQLTTGAEVYYMADSSGLIRDAASQPAPRKPAVDLSAHDSDAYDWYEK